MPTVGEAAAVSVSAASRAKLLRLLCNGRGLDDAALEAGLPDVLAHAVAVGAGWPDLVRVDVERRKPFRAVEVPAPRPAVEDEAPAVEEQPAAPAPGPGPEDHPAAVRALQLHQAVHARDQDRMGALGGSWTVLEVWETCVALAAMVPAGVDPEAALAWLDHPEEERARREAGAE